MSVSQDPHCLVSALGCNSMGLSVQIHLIRNLLASLNSREKGVALMFLRMVRLQCTHTDQKN